MNAVLQTLSTATTVVTDAVENSAGLDAVAIEALNARYAPLSFEQRLQALYRDFPVDKVLVTSSFAATSAFFLHVVSMLEPAQKIAFIDTGYHFPETLAYREYLIQRFGLTVFDVKPDEFHHQFTVAEKTYLSDPDLCCAVNKVQPLDAIKPRYQVWVSSLMGWQTDDRAAMKIFEPRRGIIKFNPMIDVSREQRDAYIREHDLPFHPLVAQGYSSIGCIHCTVKGEGRSGRWQGKPKTECGLHL